MTCNQLVALGCVYRGTEIPKIGTTEDDLIYLRKRKLIEDGRLAVTALGSVRFKAILDLL